MRRSIAQTGDGLSPGYHLIFTALLSLIALIAIRWAAERDPEPWRLAELCARGANRRANC
jgi:hypothetical protein